MATVKALIEKLILKLTRFLFDHNITRADLLAADRLIESLRLSPRHQELPRITRYGSKTFSQNDEDGIIEEIFNRIGTTSKKFIEFGAGDGLENNSALLLYKNWSGLWMDGGEENEKIIRTKYDEVIKEGRLVFKRCFITAESIDGHISSSGFSGEIDLLSVDLDGNDWHIFDAIKCVNPRVVIVEYNGKYPPSVDWCMRYNPGHVWAGDDYFGASLKAFEVRFAARGYALIGCNVSGINAFFVRTDLLGDHFCAPYTAENHYEPPRYFLTGCFPGGHKPSKNRFL